jgi:hypothetical protein
MLTQDLASIKGISTLQLSPVPFKNLRMALSSRRKKSVLSVGSRSTAPGGGPKAAQRPTSQHAGKRKASELASLGDSIVPANTCPTPLGSELSELSASS